MYRPVINMPSVETRVGTLPCQLLAKTVQRNPPRCYLSLRVRSQRPTEGQESTGISRQTETTARCLHDILTQAGRLGLALAASLTIACGNASQAPAVTNLESEIESVRTTLTEAWCESPNPNPDVSQETWRGSDSRDRLKVATTTNLYELLDFT
jgi:hypothetical protein